jgi:transcription antitermination factor NusG
MGQTMLSSETELWFAIHVVPQHEFKVAAQLHYKGQEAFLPAYSSRRQWSDRSKLVHRPLFPGYVFCRAKKSNFRMVLDTPGVYNIVSFGGRPYPIPETEISSIKLALASGREICAVQHVFIGQKVQVATGPLSGITGIVTRVKDRERLVISVDVLMKSVAVEIGLSEIVALDTAS